MAAASEKIEEIRSRSNDTSSWKSWIGFIISMLILFCIFHYAISFTIVSGSSMNPTIKDNQILLSNQIYYHLENDDIIVFHDPHGYDVIKRIIASPNETVEIKDGIVLINDTPLEEEYITGVSNDMEKITVADDHYFVMGDNRTPGESLDSRSSEVGLVSSAQVRGEIVFSVFPLAVKLGQ